MTEARQIARSHGSDAAMDGCVDGSSDGKDRIEVIEGLGRRLRSGAEGARIAAESMMRGSIVPMSRPSWSLRRKRDGAALCGEA